MASLNVRATVGPLRTLITSAGLKHAKQEPPLCRTLGYQTPTADWVGHLKKVEPKKMM
jgi:hypothetical protein